MAIANAVPGTRLRGLPQAETTAQESLFHDRIVPGICIGLVIVGVILTTDRPDVIKVVAWTLMAAMLIEFLIVSARMDSTRELKWEKRSWPIPVFAQLGAIVALPFTLIPLASKDGPKALVLLVGCTFIADITAFLVGRSMKYQWFGERHFFHDISPNKCLEGWVAGLAASFVVAIALKLTVGLSIPILILLPMVLVATLLGFAGDLMESWFKRSVKVKDTSRVLRGHGGILDRHDDLLYVSPFICLFWILLQWHWF